MAENDAVRYAVVGCGSVGPVHADAVAKSPDADLVGICDLIEKRAVSAAERFGGTPYTDLDEMLRAEQPDAVSICTPHHNHAELTMACLRSGAHVLCEKPLALSSDQMDSMIAAARETGRVLSGVFQHRFDPITATLKEAAEQGFFGRVLNAGAYIRCFRGREYYDSGEWRGTWAGEGGAVLINQAIHSIDVMQWLAGPVKSVFGRHATIELADAIEAEDTASAFVEFQSGAIGTIEATSASHMNFAAGVHFYGTHGSFRLDTGGRDELEFLEVADEEQELELRRMLEAAREGERGETVGKQEYGNSHQRQIADFVDAIRAGREPEVTGEEARHAVEIVLAVYESARLGKSVDLGGVEAVG